MNTNNTFYRIAHKVTARGVYYRNSYCRDNNLMEYFEDDLDEMSYKHSDNILKTPCLSDDTFLYNNKFYGDNLLRLGKEYSNRLRDNIYCFNSIEQLKSWFTDDELSLLHSKMFHIIEFSVNEQLGCYKVYDRQCIVPLVCFLDDNLTTINKCISINTILG